MFVKIDGPSDGHVVLFANSLAADLEMWSAQVGPLVSAGYRVVRFDARGHGRSPATPAPYPLTTLAGDLLDVADEVGAERFSLVGCSLGGMVAQRVAIDRPERVAALVLTATAPRIGTAQLWDQRVAGVRREGLAGLADRTMSRWFTRAVPATEIQRIHASVMRTSIEGFCGAALAMRDVDLTPELGSIRAPTLILSGIHDAGTPVSAGETLDAAISDARFLVLDAAHFLHLEQAGVFNAALLDHLERNRT